MSLIVDGNIFSFSGSTFVKARASDLTILRSDKILDQIKIESSIEWLKVAPDGETVLIYTDRATRVWRWREGFGVERFLEASDHRDVIGCGFVVSKGTVVTLISQGGNLRGISAEGVDLFSNNLRSPHSFFPRNFVQLPGERVSLIGSFFADPYDAALTVGLNDLSQNPEAIQQAVSTKIPVWDRAINLMVGPCEPNSAVVLRDPQDTEIPEDVDDPEDLPDVYNFTGLYIRDLDTGALIGQHPYTSRAGSAVAIGATRDLIVVQVVSGIDIINGATGATENLPKAILDVSGLQVARLDNNNDLSEVKSLETFAGL
jgi:hypothetical protein